jgi:DNA-binding GntR family transcriptional regulator
MSLTAKYGLPDISAAEAMTTQDYAYARVHNAIMQGALEPGTALTIRGLADDLGLSQTPVREAVRRLSSENAIEVLGNRRLKVPEMSAGRFEELVLLRITLETHAAERSLPYVSDIVVNGMRKLDEEMESAIARNDIDLLTRLNQAFHRTLYCMNPDQTVMPLIESVWLQLGPFQRQVVENVKSYYAIDRHQELLAALDKRDLVTLNAALEGDIRDGILRAGRKLLRRRAADAETD